MGLAGTTFPVVWAEPEMGELNDLFSFISLFLSFSIFSRTGMYDTNGMEFGKKRLKSGV